MPANFQNAIDLTLNNKKDTFAFLDDIIIISHGTNEQHRKINTVLNKWDAKNMAISVDKGKFGCREAEWLGFVINEYGPTPMQKKTDAIINLQHPKNIQATEKL